MVVQQFNEKAQWIWKVKEVLEKLNKGEPIRLSKIPSAQYERASYKGKIQLLRGKLGDVLELAEVPLTKRILCFKHADKNPSMEFRKPIQALRCYHCGESGKTWDTFDMIGFLLGIDLFPDKLRIAKKLFVDEKSTTLSKQTQISPATSKQQTTKNVEIAAPRSYKKSTDTTNTNKERKYKDFWEDLECLNFLKQRGITLESAKKFRLKCWENSYTRDRYLVIPCEKMFCVRRRYKDVSGIKRKKFSNPENPDDKPELKVSLFNGQCLKTCADAELIFVLESTVDAILMYQMGFKAIALNGGGNDKLILAQEETIRRKQIRLLLLLDNDSTNAGRDYAIKIHKAFKGKGIPSYMHWYEKFGAAAFLANYKDIGQAYVDDPEKTAGALHELVTWLNTPLEDLFPMSPEDLETLKKMTTTFNLDELFGRTVGQLTFMNHFIGSLADRQIINKGED